MNEQLRTPGRAAQADGARPAPSGFRTLRWLAIVLPVGFIVGLNYLLHTALQGLDEFPGDLLVLALLVGLTVAFSFAVFGLVERLERGILKRNAMLAALVAVGREAGSSLDLDQLLEGTLAAILETSSADAAEVRLHEQDGSPARSHRRGLPAEAMPGALRLHMPLGHRGESYGVLAVEGRDRPALEDRVERELLEGIAERLGVAIENSRLHEQVLDAAVLRERERISRELHDGLAQVLGYINTQTLAVRMLLASERPEEAAAQLEAMEKAAKQVYGDVREAIFSLRSPPGDGLAAAVRAQLEDYRAMPGVPAAVEVVEEGELPELPPATEMQLLWIVQEALNNVRNHAEAGQATVRFRATGGDLLVSVEDDGRGFRPERRARTGWPHFGLQTMRERAEAIGGSIEIDSEVDRGTAVRVRVPVAQVEASAA